MSSQDPFAAFGGQALDSPPSADPFAAFGGQALSTTAAPQPRQKHWSEMTPEERTQLVAQRKPITTSQFESAQPGFASQFGGRVAENVQNVVTQPLSALKQAVTGGGTSQGQAMLRSIPGGLKAATWDTAPKVFDAMLQRKSPAEAADIAADFLTNTAPLMLGAAKSVPTEALSNPENYMTAANKLRDASASIPSVKAGVVAGGATELIGALTGHPLAGAAGFFAPLAARFGLDGAANILERIAKKLPQEPPAANMPATPPNLPLTQMSTPIGQLGVDTAVGRAAPNRPIGAGGDIPAEGGGRVAPTYQPPVANQPPLPSEPTQYGQIPGQQQTPLNVQRPQPGAIPQTASTNPVIAITQKLSGGKIPSKNLVQAASRLAQSDPYIANLSPEALQESLRNSYKAAGEAINSALAKVPSDTTVDMINAKLAWVQQAQQAQESGMTASANKLMGMVKSTPDKIGWNQFLSVKDSLKSAAFGGRSRNFALSQAYGDLIDASRGISKELDAANAQSSLYRSVLDAAKIHPETGITYR